MSKNTFTENIVIFEDDENTCREMEDSFKEVLKNPKIPFKFFSAEGDRSEEAFEESLKKDLRNYGNIGLILCDQEIRAMRGYIGLSSANISRLADELAVPICLYAQGTYKNAFEKIKRWTDLRIILDVKRETGKLTYERLADECKSLYKGFQTIESKYKKIKRKKITTIADMLAQVLEKPQYKDRIALYGTGDRQMLAEILPYKTEGSSKIKEENKRIPRLLGYWLWNSILRFPGAILNQTASASFLNIDVDQFYENKKLQNLFKKAKYTGPFSEMQNFWWRDDLEGILFDSACENGLQLAKKKGFKRINNCKCSVDPSKSAGYYCMITEKPVSAENSCSNINWFPSGADLARISKPKFDELVPWLGLY
jgi:hypothetical protein